MILKLLWYTILFAMLITGFILLISSWFSWCAGLPISPVFQVLVAFSPGILYASVVLAIVMIAEG